jgi:hypothetical protein
LFVCFLVVVVVVFGVCVCVFLFYFLASESYLLYRVIFLQPTRKKKWAKGHKFYYQSTRGQISI